ncbi:hypothetical protein PH5382_01296 [Phaeobacter sp. CECT 5382]|uniref:nuclear transport factor 2 family protein n=1 Tax=Phaeobacter sp. CECT 5382 TaxID=1712645 RepID=UPI0006D9BFE3|nr:nuclear transport factor 2 family protein [Phaeobacter sp. CECT 5382]CUH87369.1 hypothetical protein PH5382_01296 [Phaeobacter sp. CECT 5382]
MTENKWDEPERLSEILEQEHRVWQALVAGDAITDNEALHADFLGVYPSGFATRTDHVAQLTKGPSVQSYTISEPRLLDLGKCHQCLSYRASFIRPGETAEQVMYVSSIWRQQNGAWINIFSQDTPADAKNGGA